VEQRGELIELDSVRKKADSRVVPTSHEHWSALLEWRELGEELSEAELRRAIDVVRSLPAWSYSRPR